jgi:serpin B
MNWFPFKKTLNNNESAILEAAVQGNTKFALELYQKLWSTEGNLFFSPYSVSAALAVAYAGARGDTRTQMARALSFLQDQTRLQTAFALLREKLEESGRRGHIQVSTANTLWPRIGCEFPGGFLKLARKYYGVQITPVDYGDEETARRTINSWVEEKTQNRIKDLISAGVLDSMTRLVLVNAIYFKGDWATRFDPELTSQEPFLVAQGSQVQVPMMKLKHDFNYAESDSLQVLELPYAGDDLAMILLLPREVSGLAGLEGSLAVENLDTWTKNLEKVEVDVCLPRFELSFPFRLDDTLRSMGMIAAFSDQADFSGMDGSRELYIGAVLHKAFVSVNEQGTEAAAATALTMQTKALSIPVVFRADHPFLFLIRAKSTGSILFIGRVANPVQG